MRIANYVMTVLAAAVMAASAGCSLDNANAVKDKNIVANTARTSDLSVTIAAPKKVYAVGERIEVQVTVKNLTNHPITINAKSNAEVLVTLSQRAKDYVDELRHYPEFSLRVVSPWTLQAQATRNFTLMIPVEPTWPAGAPLMLSAELNGRPDARPTVNISVALQAKQ